MNFPLEAEFDYILILNCQALHLTDDSIDAIDLFDLNIVFLFHQADVLSFVEFIILAYYVRYLCDLFSKTICCFLTEDFDFIVEY